MSGSYPGSDLTFTQLLYALTRKLNSDATSCISIRANFNSQILSELETIITCSHAQIRSFRNAFTLINRLSPETLSSIFGFARSACSERDTGSWLAPYGWITVTHVCRYWRNSALCSPSTWMNVDSRFPAMIHLCLERSKYASLDVRLRSGCRKDLFLAIQPHIHRVHELTVDFNLYDDSPLISLILLSFKENMMPSLSCLSISRFLAGPLISHISNLTQLDLRDADPHFGTKMTRFLDVLESSPNLYFMTIVSAGPREEDGNSNRIVHLHSLVKLTLSQCAVKIILGHLSLPLKTSIIIESIRISNVSSLMKETLPTSLKQLTNLHKLERIGFSKHSQISCSFAADGPSGSIAINAKIPNDTPNPYFDGPSFLLSVPPLSVAYIRHLWLDNITIVPDSRNGAKTALGTTFGSMPKLETLALLRCWSNSIFQALQPNGNQIVCDALVSITIFDNSYISYPDLLTLAANRAAAGAAFEHISVICTPGKNVSGAEIMKLKKQVRHVEYKIDDEGPKWPFKHMDSDVLQ